MCRRALASEYRGQVIYGGQPVPGATVTATHGGKKLSVITDERGRYSFANLADGPWAIEVEMLCFTTLKQDVTVGPNAPAATWELKLLSLEEIRAQAKVMIAAEAAAAAKADTTAAQNAPPDALQAAAASDGLLINGSVVNAATSAFAQTAAFGNNRTNGKTLYNGSLGVTLGNSALDARTYALTGLLSPKPEYNRLTGMATFGGRLAIPHLMPIGPTFFVGYQWSRDSTANTISTQVPDAEQRMGNFSHTTNSSGQPVQIYDPSTGLPYAGNIVPLNAQAQALLSYYPLPNLAGNSQYNYQVPLLNSTHQDALQSRLNKNFGSKDQFYGGFAFQSSRSATENLFHFVDTTRTLGLNGNVNWSHRFRQRLSMTLGYQFSRLSTKVTPFWENRANVSGSAGITGNNQDSMNWGPPTLSFYSGIYGLTDGNSSHNRAETNGSSFSMMWNHNQHNITVGGDFKREELNDFGQSNPRGSFTFTGAATQGSASGSGYDLADFAIGVPDASSVAFGNAEKYLRQSVADVYIADDWRITPVFTASLGVRWEYAAPITELFGRLVNLDIAPGFSSVRPVVANNPTGPLTGSRYPSSLLQPFKGGFQPRIGISWRPLSGSSLVVRAGYGIYNDTSIYPRIAREMSQQFPLSTSLSVQNSAACPLTLANGFNSCAGITPNTFAVDPNLSVGYAQNWQLSIQKDLPAALQMNITYLGIKGTHGLQEFLPNTNPLGATDPCSSCPSGFAYLTSGGNSTRQAAQVQLRRRLRSGFTATVQYTYAKAIDNDSALGGPVTAGTAQTSSSTGGIGLTSLTIAQNWRNLRGERGLSTFDQRHLLSVQMQYTTGMGLGGGTLLSGWRGRAYKEWTVSSQITAGSGLPQTPIYPGIVGGTGVSGSLRPNFTGASLYNAPAGLGINPAAYTAPVAGQWGTAGRNSIVGPGQFSLDLSMARTFRIHHDKWSLDFRVDSTNFLNHPTFTTWNAIYGNAQFGRPSAVNSMRSLRSTLRMRF
jgi:hypothetical protein